jgi:hypothetical protein
VFELIGQAVPSYRGSQGGLRADWIQSA